MESSQLKMGASGTCQSQLIRNGPNILKLFKRDKTESMVQARRQGEPLNEGLARALPASQCQFGFSVQEIWLSFRPKKIEIEVSPFAGPGGTDAIAETRTLNTEIQHLR